MGIGFLLLVPSALAGDRLSAFLGFLIISAALAFAAALTVVLRLAIRMSAIGESLEEVRKQLEGIEQAGKVQELAAVEPGDPTTQILNLAAIGPGDPSALTAGLLEQARFPRIAPAVVEGSSAGGTDRRFDRSANTRVKGRAAGVAGPSEDGSMPTGKSGTAGRDLLRVWGGALRESDLATCREVLANLVDTAELTSQLDDLSERTECCLRAAFAECVRKRDYTTALAVGGRIRELFPDRRIARDFERVRPYLQDRASAAEEIAALQKTKMEG